MQKSKQNTRILSKKKNLLKTCLIRNLLKKTNNNRIRNTYTETQEKKDNTHIHTYVLSHIFVHRAPLFGYCVLDYCSARFLRRHN